MWHCCRTTDRFLDYAREQAASGRRLVLATASNRKYADQVAAHLGIFAEVIASDAQHNVFGRNQGAMSRRAVR